MLSLSTVAIAEKNKLATDSVWFILLEVLYPNEEPIRVVLNTEEVVWNGCTWYPCPFILSDRTETKEAELPQITLTFIDIQRKRIPIIEQYKGGVGATVIIRIVNSKNLDSSTPELEEEFEILEASVDRNMVITFKLGATNLYMLRLPQDRYLKDHCRWEFKSPECGYQGEETECDRTFTRCVQLGNQARFGGFPGIGKYGIKR